MNHRSPTPPPDPSGIINSDAVAVILHGDADTVLPKKTNCCDALNWAKPVLFTLTGCTTIFVVMANIIYLNESGYSHTYTGISAAISIVPAIGLSKRLTIDSTQEFIDALNYIRHPESAAYVDWPTLSKIKENTTRAIAVTTGLLSGVLNGYPIYYFGTTIIPKHFELDESLGSYLPLFQVGASILAIGAGLNIAISRSMPIYINLRNLMAKRNPFSRILTPIIVGGLGIGYAVVVTVNAQQFMIEASNSEDNLAAIYSLVAIFSLPEFVGAMMSDVVYAIQFIEEDIKYISETYCGNINFKWQKLAAAIISGALAITYSIGQAPLVQDPVDTYAGYFGIDTPNMIKIGTPILTSLFIVFSLSLDWRTTYPAVYGTGSKIKNAISWLNEKCHKKTDNAENKPLISDTDPDIENITSGKPNPHRFFSQYGSINDPSISDLDINAEKVKSKKRCGGCNIL